MRPLYWPLTALGLLACSGEDKLTANNTHPEAVITSHGAGDTVREGSEVTFSGSGSDKEDGPDRLLTSWLIDGEISCESAAPESDGRTSCTVAIPEAEALEVRLEVRDSGNALTADERTLEIKATDEPVVEITAPDDPVSATAGESISFSAIVSDEEDAPEDLILWWESSEDGVIEIPDRPDSSGLVTGQLNDLSVGAYTSAP